MSFPPIPHIIKEEEEEVEEEGAVLTSLPEEVGLPEEIMPNGSWTPHILTSKDNNIPESLSMSRYDTKLSECEDHGPASLEVTCEGVEKLESSCRPLQCDFVYTNAVKHFLGPDGFELIRDTVQDQLQCLRAHRQTDHNQKHHMHQRNGSVQREESRDGSSDKADVRMSVLACSVSGHSPCTCGVSGHSPCTCGVSGHSPCTCGVSGHRPCTCGVSGTTSCIAWLL